MPYATNALDGSRVYFEDDGGHGAPVVLHGGIIDSVDLVRDSNIAQALQGLPTDEFRLIYVAHRGVGRSDKPHEVEAYAMPLRVADAVRELISPSAWRNRPKRVGGGCSVALPKLTGHIRWRKLGNLQLARHIPQ